MGANRAPTGMRHMSHDTRPAHVTGMFVHSRHANYGKEITLRVKGPSGIFDARSPPDLMLRMYKTGCTDLRGLAIFITRLRSILSSRSLAHDHAFVRALSHARAAGHLHRASLHSAPPCSCHAHAAPHALSRTPSPPARAPFTCLCLHVHLMRENLRMGAGMV